MRRRVPLPLFSTTVGAAMRAQSAVNLAAPYTSVDLTTVEFEVLEEPSSAIFRPVSTTPGVVLAVEGIVVHSWSSDGFRLAVPG